MPQRRLTEKEKKKIEELWLKIPLARIQRLATPNVSDSTIIEGKTGITSSKVARYIQELTQKKYGPDAPLTYEQKEQIEKLLTDGIPEQYVKFKFSPAKWINLVSRIHQQKIEGWISQLKKTKCAVLIIDTTSPSREKKSESDFMQELLQIYNSARPVKPNSIPIKAKDDFIQTIRAARQRYIHISAHGIAHDEDGNPIETNIQAGIWKSLVAGDIYNENRGRVESLWPDKNQAPYLIVAAACEAGRIDIADAFLKAGCKHYIAPLKKVPWANSAVFCTLFYYYLIARGWSPYVAFNKTVERLPDKSGRWKFFRQRRKTARRNVPNKC